MAANPKNNKKSSFSLHWRMRLLAGASTFLFVFTFLPQRASALVDLAALFGILTGFMTMFANTSQNLSTSAGNYLGTYTNDLSTRLSPEAIRALRTVPISNNAYDTSGLLNSYLQNVAGNRQISTITTNRTLIQSELAMLTAEALRTTSYFLTDSNGLQLEAQLRNIDQVSDLLTALSALIPAATAACAASIFGSSTCSAIQGIIAQIEAVKGALQTQISATEITQRQIVDTQTMAGLAANIQLLRSLLNLQQSQELTNGAASGRTVVIVTAPFEPPPTRSNNAISPWPY
jgi:hypothetical protein